MCFHSWVENCVNLLDSAESDVKTAVTSVCFKPTSSSFEFKHTTLKKKGTPFFQ